MADRPGNKKKILVADLLCGAGGSTTGCERALLSLGWTIDQIEFVCVNHWATAIETHTINHPRARHYVQDIATGRPHLMVPEGYLDLLMASPTCTHHSNARGGKPTSDQQRSDPWHIITWLTELRVKRIIIENVWEFIGWGPVDRRTGKPIASRKGEYFWAWINAIKALGFTVEWRKLNAADYGDATTRQRFILMGRSDGKKIHFPAATHCRAPSGADLFPTLKPWRPAREIIDWGLRGRSIFAREKPLAPKTLQRIWAGAVKFGWSEPYLVMLRNHMTAQGLDVPLPTITGGGTHLGLAQPVVLSQHSTGAPRSTTDPLPTIMTGGAGNEGRPGCARPMLVEPLIVNMKGRSTASSVEQPLPTQTAHAGHLFAAEPFVLSQASGGAARAVGEPLPTIVVTGGAGGSGTALISPYYGSGSGETCSSTDDVLPTVTAKGRFGMVVPVTHGAGHPARPVEEPLPTMTTAKGGEFAMAVPVTHVDSANRARDPGQEPLPTVTGASRGELAFIAAQISEPAAQYDILFRMLEPHELAAAMGFDTDSQRYAFAGTKTEMIKQIGNAVSVEKMKACVTSIMADAAPARRVKPARKIAA